MIRVPAEIQVRIIRPQPEDAVPRALINEAVEEINNAGGAKNPAFKFVCGGGIGILLGVGLFLALNICGVNFGNMETIVILGIPCCLGLMSSYIIF